MKKVGRYVFVQVFLQITEDNAVQDLTAQDKLREDISRAVVADIPNAWVDEILTLNRK
jgi:predicted Co/Zn/Cd cation transporter (cation efflux family)